MNNKTVVQRGYQVYSRLGMTTDWMETQATSLLNYLGYSPYTRGKQKAQGC